MATATHFCNSEEGLYRDEGKLCTALGIIAK
jgi:hypothetical protein